MGFQLSEEIEQMRDETSKLVDQLLAHEQSFATTNVVPPQAHQAFASLGYYGMRIPEEYGGMALGMLPTVAVVKELGRLPPQFWSFLRTALGPTSKSIVLHGNASQKDKWLPAIAAGNCGVAFALTESEAGSDLGAMRTKADRRGGEYVLNGAKTYISNADKAKLFVVFARTASGVELKRSISTFLIEAGHPGMTVGPAMPTMGTTHTGLFEVSFNDCAIPASALLGDEGAGFKYAMESLNEGRLNVGAIAIGMGQYALELALEHTKTRVAFGQPIASNQVVQHMLANAAMELHAGWLSVIDGAQRLDAGLDASASSAMVKVFCSEAASRAIDTGVQLFGASGYSRGFAVERLYRDVRVLRIYEGASEILRNAVAKKLLSEGCRIL
ncbi:acyl-CoA dehydrogenase family protein [soil metagenome]